MADEQPKKPPRASLIEQMGNKYLPTALGLDTIEQLASIGSTPGEIARYLGVSAAWMKRAIKEDDDFYIRSVAHAYEDGQGEFKRRLRRAQVNLSETNAQMAIHLGKQYLDQRDNPVEHNLTISVVGTMPDYDTTSDDWKRQFAPSPMQGVTQQKPTILEAEVVEDGDDETE